MAKPTNAIEIPVDGLAVRVTNADRELKPGWSKGEVIQWFVAIGPVLRPRVAERPTYVVRAARDGAEPFFQKRISANAPDWVGRVEVPFPSNRSATVVAPAEEHAIATLCWLANLGGIEFHTWASHADSVEHFDELRIDLDPETGSDWAVAREAAFAARDFLSEHGLHARVHWSGKRGVHLIVPLEVPAPILHTRSAALGVARALEARHPDLITAQWWKEERRAPVFCDFNQMLLDRTMAMPYSPRVGEHTGVVLPMSWEALAAFEPHSISGAEAFEMAADVLQTAPPAPPAGDLTPLLELHAAQRAAGAPEAPYPPHYPKMPDELPRVMPSRAKKRESS